MKLIYQKIPLIMEDIGVIGKDSRNEHQKYDFRGIESMYNVIQPVLRKHKVFCVPQVLEVRTDALEINDGQKTKYNYRSILTIKHSFFAEDGSCVDVITVGEGIDSSDKASNKAMSGAMKYAFIELFSIPTKDVVDSDSETPEGGKPTGFKVTNVKAGKSSADDFLGGV